MKVIGDEALDEPLEKGVDAGQVKLLFPASG
jgi:hypothetical protein